MRTIIAGSREIPEGATVEAIEGCPWKDEIGVVLCGEARGPDRDGATWARAHGLLVESYPAHWNEEGKSAGFLRNQRMADGAEGLMIIWDGTSRGSASMIQMALKRGLRVHIAFVDADGHIYKREDRN